MVRLFHTMHGGSEIWAGVPVSYGAMNRQLQIGTRISRRMYR